MSISSPYVLYVNNTCYDLTKVCSWFEAPEDQTVVCVRFWDTGNTFVRFDKTAFETAYQAACTAGFQ